MCTHTSGHVKTLLSQIEPCSKSISCQCRPYSHTSLPTLLPHVLQAPPGAGKTTTVPLALLLHQPQYLKQGQTIMVSSLALCAGLRAFWLTTQASLAALLKKQRHHVCSTASQALQTRLPGIERWHAEVASYLPTLAPASPCVLSLPAAVSAACACALVIGVGAASCCGQSCCTPHGSTAGRACGAHCGLPSEAGEPRQLSHTH
jgi:hypothetical protein